MAQFSNQETELVIENWQKNEFPVELVVLFWIMKLTKPSVGKFEMKFDIVKERKRGETEITRIFGSC